VVTDPRTPGPGWFGTLGQVKHVLRTIRADQDADGAFIVRGTIATLLGGSSDSADCVVGPDAQYRRAGLWAGLAGAMNATSYGLHGVTVI
jgi:hypothetical protein